MTIRWWHLVGFGLLCCSPGIYILKHITPVESVAWLLVAFKPLFLIFVFVRFREWSYLCAGLGIMLSDLAWMAYLIGR